ncbi:soluble NSF attachment family protein [Terrimonas sp. NA20]|uniref:Soluble NSF attachment family protein n=1 Tax=Terrimonas ginsenosidimutans TaxID=2908004 RepID=A0ABS9KJY1_9BACT|nr:soluble NSF attachment family protein [Terrimonas ginsenosidimutans]MCG2612632.1 soluble NSF attachment family protein [Terrimonas ginsenosidimutans]
MHLHLKYNAHPPASADAAFIAGADPLIWLKEISFWKLSPSQIECYVLPESRSSGRAAGLFVIFKRPETAKSLSLLDPYVQIVPKLFIPAQASLSPSLSKEELQTLTIWHQQVFHPVSGFTGFDKKDEVDLTVLVRTVPALSSDWSFAHPGLAAKPGLTRIEITQSSSEALMEEFKKMIGMKPLNEIPETEKEPLLRKIFDGIILVLFTILSFFGKLISRLLPSPSPATGRPSAPSNNEGWFSRFMNWLDGRIEDLQSKRDKELQRLMKKFDKNDRDALDYAIPLSSQYMNRGKAAKPSSKLSRRPFKFNFGRLGGGMAADAWNVDRYYDDLRTRYLRSAENEIAQKDFKRAAYIYAHLLGDYRSAAWCLEQGNHYREAALLYKDHLKDKAAAARCLENGKLYTEAIELYAELDYNEKVGDLYTVLEQKPAADAHYEKFISAQVRANNHREAARVMSDKMHDTPRAKLVLLDGWRSAYNGESCLKNYFDLVGKDHSDDLGKRIKDVYVNDTSHSNKKQFLNVLEYVHKKNEGTDVNFEAQEIAYEIVCEGAATGDSSLVNYLERFFPGDKLISRDSTRYLTGDNKKMPDPAAGTIHLDSSINWFTGVWHRDQFLVLGRKNDCLHLARVNYEGVVEYFSWTNPIPQGTWFRFISNPFLVNTVFLYSSTRMPIEKKAMLRSKDFKEYLLVGSPDWLKSPQAVLSTAREVTLFESHIAYGCLLEYRISGEFYKEIKCEGIPDKIPASAMLAFHNGHYYTQTERSFIWIQKMTHQIIHYRLPSVLRLFAINHYSDEMAAIISTNKGCYLFMKEENSGGHLLEDVFAETLIPSMIQFISDSFFVIAETRAALLFELSGGNIAPRFVKNYKTSQKIVAVMPGMKKGEFLLICQEGDITRCCF